MTTKTKELKLSTAEQAKFEAKIEEAKAEVLGKREAISERNAAWKELWQDRYECKITSTIKGEKSVPINVESENDPDVPVRLNVAVGTWIREQHGGLPMFVIQRLQQCFDTAASERGELPTGDAGVIHITHREPRYVVEIGKKCDPDKRKDK